MNFARILGRLLNIDNVESIDQFRVTFAAPWAASAPAWVFFGCVLLMVGSIWFYRKYQRGKHSAARLTLAIVRGLVLSALFVILAEPELRIGVTNYPRPLLYVLIDGTDSMAIEERPGEEYREKLDESLGIKLAGDDRVSRIDCVKKWVADPDNNTLEKLEEKFRLQFFLLDQRSGARSLPASAAGQSELDPQFIAENLTTTGQTTALGNGVQDLSQRHAAGQVAGMVIVSDFVANDNHSRPLTGEGSVANKFGHPIYTVGVGIEEPAELVVECQARPFMKNENKYPVQVSLKQSGLKDKVAHVNLFAVPLNDDGSHSTRQPIGTREITLTEPTTTLEFPYTPHATGHYQLVAEVNRFPEEAASDDELHRFERAIEVGDNFVRLMYVAYEPEWEWRFIKEVFYRDPRVGKKGFRTYLYSSDPDVRREKDLFLTSLNSPRSEFFANDVIFLGDVPKEMLDEKFCKNVHEFVYEFGGSLVVLAGPRFGPTQLADTVLKDALPVDFEPGERANDQREFRLHLTESGLQHPFMKLGDNAEEHNKAWNNLRRVPWYQPVRKAKDKADVLAVHPTDYCPDGQEKQPLIVFQRYGNGKVLYVGFNEMWRLRRKYGEKYYAQFWGGVFDDLGFSRRSGEQRRFGVRLDKDDKPIYKVGEKVAVTVDAYDDDFEPLTREKIAEGRLSAELTITGSGDSGSDEPATVKEVSIPFAKKGIFEARIPVFQEGEYQIRVRDPIKNQYTEPRAFRVVSESSERINAQRNFQLERELANVTNGVSYDITNATRLADEISVPELKETSIRMFPLWDTWLCFLLVLGLMLGEWAGRKWIHLP